MTTPATRAPVIVVGLDGSAASEAALRWAVRTAASRGAAVRAVNVAPRAPLLPATSLALHPHGTIPVADSETRMEPLRAAIDAARTATTDPPPVTLTTVTGDIAHELVAAAGDDALLAIGYHARGAVTGTLLGRTASECVRAARCPVVLINAQAGGSRAAS